MTPASPQSEALIVDVAVALERKIVSAAIEAALVLSNGKDLTRGAKGGSFWAGYETGIEEVATRIADAQRLLPQVAGAPVSQAVPERSAFDWRRLTGLWRYGVAVLPPTCPDFYNWLDILDAAIDGRTSRAAPPPHEAKGELR
jgi:hypothetical protein